MKSKMKPQNRLILLGHAALLAGLVLYFCIIQSQTLSYTVPYETLNGILIGFSALGGACFLGAALLWLLPRTKIKQPAPSAAADESCSATATAAHALAAVAHALLIAGSGYFLYAVNHPELTVPLPLGVLSGIYTAYPILTGICFAVAIALKLALLVRRKNRRPSPQPQA